MTVFKPDATKPPIFLIARYKTYAFCLVLFLLSVACSNNQLYKRYIALPNGVWNMGERIRFVANIPPKYANNKGATLTLLLRYNTPYKHPNLLLKLRIKEPGNTDFTTEQTYDLPMKNPDGSNAGSGMGSLWDIKFTLLQNTLLLPKPGNYELEIEQLMPTEQLYFIQEVGLLIER